MKITNKLQYLLIYDNNGQYEDHYTTPLAVCQSSRKAQRFATECNNWIKKINEEKPRWGYDKEGETNEEYKIRLDSFNAYFDDLNPIFPQLKEDMEYNQGGRVYVVELPIVS